MKRRRFTSHQMVGPMTQIAREAYYAGVRRGLFVGFLIGLMLGAALALVVRR